MRTDAKLPPGVRGELEAIACRVYWWKTPEQALADLPRFAAQVMAHGDFRDVRTVRETLGEDLFRAGLSSPPPGVFDIRSWHYWHHFFGVDIVPPLPTRQL